MLIEFSISVVETLYTAYLQVLCISTGLKNRFKHILENDLHLMLLHLEALLYTFWVFCLLKQYTFGAWSNKQLCMCICGTSVCVLVLMSSAYLTETLKSLPTTY